MSYHELAIIFRKGNISIKLLLPIAVLAGCLIFLPNDVKVLLSVDLFAEKYKEYIGPAFLISSVIVTLTFILYIYNGIDHKFRLNKIGKQIRESVKNLTYYEKSLLREFFLLGSDTIPMPLQNATVAGLLNKRIIYQVGAYGGISYREPCLNFNDRYRKKEYHTRFNRLAFNTI